MARQPNCLGDASACLVGRNAEIAPLKNDRRKIEDGIRTQGHTICCIRSHRGSSRAEDASGA